MSLTGVVERAKAEAQRERQQRSDQLLDAAKLVLSLPELMAHERAVRGGLTRSAAAAQAGVSHQVWAALERRHTTAHSSTAARILQWMAT